MWREETQLEGDLKRNYILKTAISSNNLDGALRQIWEGGFYEIRTCTSQYSFIAARLTFPFYEFSRHLEVGYRKSAYGHTLGLIEQERCIQDLRSSHRGRVPRKLRGRLSRASKNLWYAYTSPGICIEFVNSPNLASLFLQVKNLITGFRRNLRVLQNSLTSTRLRYLSITSSIFPPFYPSSAPAAEQFVIY